jgi:hypothetical protein
MNSPSPVLTWLDDHPQGSLWLAAAVIATGATLALRSWLRPEPGARPGPDWRWGLMLATILLAGRWPSLLIPRELNPDESHLFAAAHALTHDPVPWRSINGATSGPLNFLPLIPVGWLAGWDSYPGLRLAALGLLGASLILIHQCLSLVYPPRAVRLATFSAALLVALTNSVDLLHYSSELVPVFCLSAAAYAAARRGLQAGGPAWSGLGGLMLGAVPLCKLQAAPLALAAGLYWLGVELRARGPAANRHRVYLLAGAVLPAGLILFPVLLAGQWDNFVTTYLFANLSYAATGSSSAGNLIALILAKSFEQDSLLHLWLPGTILWSALAFRGRALPDRAARQFTLLALAATAISVFCVLRPGRPFLHYWQLVIPPLTLLLGALLGNLATATPDGPSKFNRWLMAACALALLGTLGGHRLRVPNLFVGAFAYFEAHPREPLSDRIRAHAQPGEAIAIWGWSNYLYVETGLRQATRESNLEGSILPGPYQQFFRDRFLADLMVARPATFVDSVGPGSIIYQAPALRHDRNYPELAAVIRADYVLVDEFEQSRIYRRRDLAPR